VELSQVVHRVLGRHWLLIAVCLLLGVSVPMAVHLNDPRMYSAAARLSLDISDPTSSEESTAIADTARAMATSTKLVAAALVEADVLRDAERVATRAVSVRALGSSGVLELKVRDRDPNAASEVANALAAEIISTRETVTLGRIPNALHEIGEQIGDINRQLLQIDKQLPSDKPSEARALADERRELSEQRASLEAQRESLLASQISRPEPSIIDSARPAAEPDPSGLVTEAALGALMGLLVGVGLAALVESLTPTVVGAAALSQTLDVPVLGRLPGPLGKVTPSNASMIASRIRLATRAAGVETVELIAAGKPIELDSLAVRLFALQGSNGVDATVRANSAKDLDTVAGFTLTPPRPPSTGGVILRPQERPPRVFVSPFDPVKAATRNGAGFSGLLVVTPRVIKKARLDETRGLLTTVGWPVLGLITYRPSRLAALRFWRGE
jgi:capsular polysaccharide biosynthesis protein